jgi:beta-glucosidase
LSDRWRQGGGLVQADDLRRIQAPVDFLSINSYHPRYVCAPHRVDRARMEGYAGGYASPFAFGLPFVDVEPATATKTDIGWIVEPKGIEDLLLRLGRELPSIPLYVSENGAAYADYTDPAGQVADDERIHYLDRHLRAACAAIDQGIDLRGYWAWSFMDNFEWAFGFSKRFGLVYIDYPTGKRVLKSSFYWFQELIRSRETAKRLVSA